MEALKLVVKGAAAGIAGVGAMTAVEKLDQRLTGRPDSYVPALRLSVDQTLENATGVGAPPWTWPRDEVGIDLLHKEVYVQVTGAIADALVAPAPRELRAPPAAAPAPAGLRVGHARRVDRSHLRPARLRTPGVEGPPVRAVPAAGAVRPRAACSPTSRFTATPTPATPSRCPGRARAGDPGAGVGPADLIARGPGAGERGTD